MLPFKILDLPLDADDHAVESAYRRLILRFPPESHPKEFNTIRNAYEAIDTEEKRLTHAMGLDPALQNDYTDTPLEAALSYLRDGPMPAPPNEKDFYRFLNS